MINNALLVFVPSGERVGKASEENDLPVGILYVASVLEKLNVKVKIIDLYLYALPKDDRYGYSRLKAAIDDFHPDIVGFGGIATSYIWARELSKRARKDYPEILQIAGGALSSVSELLRRAAVDVLFHGEIEHNLPLFIEKLNRNDSYHEIPGISYLADGRDRKNHPSIQIKNLDDIPLPAYHLVDIGKYLMSKNKFLSAYKDDLHFQGLYDSISDKLKGVEHFFPIVTSRGCKYRCSFCYRQMQGYRKHSAGYVISHIEFLRGQFGINGFSFMDELFNGDKVWVMELCDAIERNGLKVAYRTNARADNVSREMLQRMYDTGCFNLNYGQESGSGKILKEYRKGISREQNIATTLLTRKCGIYSTVQLVIGSPGETRETINDTIDFLKKVSVKSYSLNYLIPLPGAPIWDYVIKNKLIDDVEGYLSKVAKWTGDPIVNLSKVPDKEWRSWRRLIQYRLDLYHAMRRKNILSRLRALLHYYLTRFLPANFKKRLKKLFGV